MKLIPILLQESVDLSDLDKIDDLLAQEIEKAEKEQTNELIGTSTALVALAIPGFLNGSIKIVRSLMKKSGIDLTKRDTPILDKIEDFIEFIATKIDQITDYPIDAVLKRTIKDPVKRKKVKGAIKVGIIAVMIIYAGIDISNSSDLVGTLGEYSSEIAADVVRNASAKNTAAVKSTIVNYIKSLG